VQRSGDLKKVTPIGRGVNETCITVVTYATFKNSKEAPCTVCNILSFSTLYGMSFCTVR